MVEAWTKAAIRLRWPIAIAWLVVMIAGGWASGRLSALQSNVFSVPGTDSEHVRNVLQEHFGDRSDGAFTVVFRVANSANPALKARLQRVVDEAATTVPGGKGTALEPAGPHVLYGNVVSTLNLAQAKSHADDLVKAIGRPPGTSAYVTGAPAIQNDLDPIFNQDLRKGESIALPIALLVLLLVFGLSWAVTIPFLFAASTVFTTLGIVYVIAHYMTMPTYVTNLVFLIGLGIAIDYSLLIVYRFREELGRGLEVEAAVIRTMQHRRPRRDLLGGDGRDRPRPAAVHASAVHARDRDRRVPAPDRLDRSPPRRSSLRCCRSTAAEERVASPVAAFLRRRVGAPGRTADVEHGFWARLARSIMRRKWRYLTVVATLLIAARNPGLLASADAGGDRGNPAVPAVGSRPERARAGARAGGNRPGSGARRHRPAGRGARARGPGGDRPARPRNPARPGGGGRLLLSARAASSTRRRATRR